MDPFRTIFVCAITYDFDGIREQETIELPPGIDSIDAREMLGWPDVERIINRFIQQYGESLSAVNFGKIEGDFDTGFTMQFFFGVDVDHQGQ